MNRITIFLSKTINLIFRLLCVTPFALILLFSYIRQFAVIIIDYLFYGGELIFYNEALNKKNVTEYLEELIREQKKNNKQ